MAAIPECKPYILQTPLKVKKQYLETVPGDNNPKVVTKEGVITNILDIYNF